PAAPRRRTPGRRDRGPGGARLGAGSRRRARWERRTRHSGLAGRRRRRGWLGGSGLPACDRAGGSPWPPRRASPALRLHSPVAQPPSEPTPWPLALKGWALAAILAAASARQAAL